VYQGVDIASAKPTLKERQGIKHFALDVVKPNQKFDVFDFVYQYKKAKNFATKHDKNLVIVGGSGFYLKALTTGISVLPKIDKTNKQKIQKSIQDIQECHRFLKSLDPTYMQKISTNDHYRIEKAITIYYTTSQTPTEYFAINPQKPISKDITILNLTIDKTTLHQNIEKRTSVMLKDGLIDEVAKLEKKFDRVCQPMGSIGIKECLRYLDGDININELKTLINQNTKTLAKQQTTFNNSQFITHTSGDSSQLTKTINQIFL
jgi:tRNA dimethylallyltransferase